uniref:DEUBAD domain-containing protein n=1 Tax=Anopheles funestus TaxID=62324 RepID=A0A4Y0BHJ5_ANOFN
MECDVSPVPSVQANRPTKQQQPQHIGTVVVTAAPAAKGTTNNGNSTSSGTVASSSTTLITSTATTGTTGITVTVGTETVEESAMEPTTTTVEDDALPSSSVVALVVAGPMHTADVEISDRKSNNSNNNHSKPHSLAGSSSSTEAPVAVIEISDHSTADDISYPELVSCVDTDINCVVLSDEYDTSLPLREDDPLNISTGSIEMLSSSQCSTPVPPVSASIVTEANTSRQARIATPTNTPKHNHHLRRNLPRLATSRQQTTVKQPQSGAGSRGGASTTTEKRQLRQTTVEGSAGGAASTMREVLASIPGFSIKPRRRTNKKLSTAAQLEQTREGCVDLETPDSILVHTNLRALLNRETFQLLPPLYQYKLVQLLPPVDRPPLPDATQCERNGIRLNPSGLNNEFYARACHEWRDRLAEGEFTPEAQLKIRSEAEREKSKLDPWKLKHFEPMWGDRKYARSFFGAAGTVANPTPPTPPPPPPPPPPSSVLVPATEVPSGAPLSSASQPSLVEVAPAQQSASVPAGTPLAASAIAAPSVSIVPMGKSVASGNATIVTVARQTQPPVAALAAANPTIRVHPATAKIDPSSRSLGKMQAITFSTAAGVRSTNVASSSSSISNNTIITSSTGTIILPSRTTITVTSGNASKNGASGSGALLRGNGGTGAGVVGGSNSGLTVVPINVLTGSSSNSSSSVGSSAVNTNRPALKTTIKLRPTTAIATSTTAAAPIGEGSKPHPYAVGPAVTNASVVIGTTTTAAAAAVGSTKRILPSAMSVSSSSSSSNSTAISSTNSIDLASTTTSMGVQNTGSLPMSPKRLRTVGAVTRSALAGTPQLPPPQHNPLPTTTTGIGAGGSTITLGSRPVVVKVVEPYRPSAMVRAVSVDPAIATGASANLKRTHSSRALTPEQSSNKMSKRKTDDSDGVVGGPHQINSSSTGSYAGSSLHNNPRRMVAVVTGTATGDGNSASSSNSISSSNAAMYISSNNSINRLITATSSTTMPASSTDGRSSKRSISSSSSNSAGGNSNSSRINISCSSTTSTINTEGLLIINSTTANTNTTATTTAAGVLLQSGMKGQRQVACDTRKTPIDGRLVYVDGGGTVNEKRRRGLTIDTVPPVAAIVGPSKRRAPRQGHKMNRNRPSGGLLTPSAATTITIVDDEVDGTSRMVVGQQEEEDSQEVMDEGDGQNPDVLRRRIVGPMVNGDVNEMNRIGRNSSPSLVPASDIILEEAIDCGDVVDNSDEHREQQSAAGIRLKGDSINMNSSPTLQETIEQQNLSSRERVMNLNHLHSISDTGGTTQMIYDQNTGQVYSVMCLPQPASSTHGTGGLSLRSLPSSLTVTALPQHQQQQQQHPPQQQPQLSISNDSSNSSSVSTTAMMAASDNHLDGGAGGGGAGAGVSTFENVLRQNVVDGDCGVGSELLIINQGNQQSNVSMQTTHREDNSIACVAEVGSMNEERRDDDDEEEEEEEEDDEGDGEQVHTTTTTTNTADEEEEEEDEEEEEEEEEEVEDGAEEVEEENGEEEPAGHEHDLIRQGLQLHDDMNVHCVEDENNTPGEFFNDEVLRTASGVTIGSKLGSYGQANLQHLHLHQQQHPNNHLHAHQRHQAAAVGGGSMMNMNLTGYHHDHELLHQQQQLQQLQGAAAATSSPSASSEQGLMMMVTTTGVDGSEDPAGGLSSNSGDMMVMTSNYCDNLSAADEADGEDEEEDEDEQCNALVGSRRELHGDEDEEEEEEDHHSHHHHDRLLLDAGSIGIGMEEEAVGTIVDQYGNHHHHPSQLNHHGAVLPQDGSEEDEEGGEEDVEEANFVLDQMQQLQQQFHLAGAQNPHQQQGLLHNHQSLVTSTGSIGTGADGSQMHLYPGPGGMLLEGGEGLVTDSQHGCVEESCDGEVEAEHQHHHQQQQHQILGEDEAQDGQQLLQQQQQSAQHQQQQQYSNNHQHQLVEKYIDEMDTLTPGASVVSDGSDPGAGYIMDTSSGEMIRTENWPQFKMEMMDATKMMVVDHHQLVDGNNSIIISPIGTSGSATMIPSPGTTTMQQHQQQQQQLHNSQSLHQHLPTANQQQRPIQQPSATPISMATTATLVQQISAHNPLQQQHQRQQQPQQQQLHTAGGNAAATTGISFLAHHTQPTVQTMTAGSAATVLNSSPHPQASPQGLNIFQLHPQQQQQHQPQHHSPQSVLGCGNSTIQLTSEIKDGIRNSMLKTEPGVSYTTIRQGNQLLTRIKLESDDSQLQAQQQQQSPQSFQTQLAKVNVVTSSPLISLGPNGQDNLTRVIESVAGNYSSVAVSGQQLAASQQQQQQQIVTHQQQPQLIQHVQTASGHQLRYEMDPTVMQQQQQQQQSPSPSQQHLIQQQQQPKFIITSRPLSAVSASAAGTKLPLTVQATNVIPHMQSPQFIQTQDQQLQVTNQPTVTALQKPIQLQKIIMATPAIGQQQQQPQQQQQQRPRLPLQRTQYSVQAIQQQQQQQQQPQQQQQQFQQLQQAPKVTQQPTPTQSQQRFQQKYVTNQLIRGQNAFLMNNVHHLQQQQTQQVAGTVGANVIVGATNVNRTKRSNETNPPGTIGTITAGNGTAGNGNSGGSSSSSGSGSSSGASKRGGRSSSSRLPPGAVNLERSYQICQAVIQNSPNRHQLKAQLKSPQAFLAASNSNSNSSISSIGSTGSSSSSSSSSGVSASSIIGNNTKEDANSSNSSGHSSAFGGVLGIGGNKVSRLVNSKRTVSVGGRPQSSIVVRQVYTGGFTGAATTSAAANASAAGGASQSNAVSIITANPSQHQQPPIHSLGEQLQQHGQIISVSAAPTIVHATAASNNNGTNGGNVNTGPGGAPVSTGNFGGKYLLVQRAAHIGEIVTPRAASAPPTHNQIQIHHVSAPQAQQQPQLHQQMAAVQQQQITQQVQHHLQQQHQHQLQQQQQQHQQSQLQQIAAGANAVAPAASLQAAITRRIPSTHVITYGQDAHLIDPTVASGNNTDSGGGTTEGGTMTVDGAGSSGTVVYADSAASSSAVAEIQLQQQFSQRQGLLDSSGNGGSSVVAVNGDTMEPGAAGVNELHTTQSAAGVTNTLVSPSGISPHQQHQFNEQLMGGGQISQNNAPINIDGVDLVVDGLINSDAVSGSNHTAAGIEPSYSGTDESSAVHPHQQQESIFSTDNDIETPNSPSPHAAGNGAEDDKDRDGTAEPVDGNVEDCLCSLNAMVICQQCGAFCHDDCISATKLCVSCVVR